jgi:hypothetical protein
VGEKFNYGKKGEFFWLLIKTSLESYFDLPKQSVFDIEIGMNLFCENKPSGGKNDPNMPNPMIILLVFNLTSICIF